MMFRQVFLMDLRRGFRTGKFWSIVLVSVLLCIGSVADFFVAARHNILSGVGLSVGAVDLLLRAMALDAFKVVLVFVFSGLYTSSFCKDESENYLRMILARTDVLTYTRSKFLANVTVILTAAILSFFLSAGVYMLSGLSFISEDPLGGMMGATIYEEIVQELPWLYLLMVALQFGMIAAACCSIGLLYSAYQPDSFISIGVSGLVFFLWLSASGTVLNMTPFNLFQLFTMSALPGSTNPSQVLTYAWGMMLPLTVIVLCCMKFEKRMKWRAENGIN